MKKIEITQTNNICIKYKMNPLTLPIEFTVLPKLDEQEELDISQYLLYAQNHPEFIEVFNADRAYSLIVNNPDYEIFENFFNEIALRGYSFYHIHSTLNHNGSITHNKRTLFQVNSKTGKVKKEERDINGTALNSPNTIVFIELEHQGNEFGHYGVYVIKEDVTVVHEFDSMMYFSLEMVDSPQYNTNSAYVRNFRAVFQKFFYTEAGYIFQTTLYNNLTDDVLP